MAEKLKANTSWMSEVWPEFEAFRADMEDARVSERVTVIIGCAMLDLAVRRILAAFMVDDAGVADNILGAEGAGGHEPLAAFSSRIKACFALGLITKDERDALDTARKVRNAFAHKLSDQISEDALSSLTDRVRRLVVPDEAASEIRGKPRKAVFRYAVVGLAFTLAGRIKQVERERRRPYAGGTISLWTAKHTAPTPPFG